MTAATYRTYAEIRAHPPAGDPALWADVRRDLQWATKHCDRAARRSAALRDNSKLAEDVKSDCQLAVAMHVHDAYRALEAALERLIIVRDALLPFGREPDAELIHRAATAVEGERPAIITRETARDLHRLRAFRHVVRHVYDDFDYSRAEPTVAVAERCTAAVAREVEAFCEAVGIKA